MKRPRKSTLSARAARAVREIAESGTLIYSEVRVIEAVKEDGVTYQHRFKPGIPIIGLADGSLLIPADSWQLWGERVTPPEPNTGSGKTQVLWDNPPGPAQGLTIRRAMGGRVYERRVPSRGLLNPTEAAQVLGISRVYLYRLIWDGRLKTTNRNGRTVVPLHSIKRYQKERHA